MFKKIRLLFVKEIIEMMEKVIFNKKLFNFYKDKFDKKINFVIDVGANVGQSIDFFLKLNSNCRIMAFEPNPTVFEKLKRKYSNNQNIQLFQLGVSDTVGQKIFHENIYTSTSTFEEFDLTSKYLKTKSKILGVKPNELTKKSYAVNVTTLSDFITGYCNHPIDVLKIDTEGHEYACLNGLFKTGQHFDIKYIQLEMHNDSMYINARSFKDISDILTKNGFKLETKINHSFGDIDEALFIKS